MSMAKVSSSRSASRYGGQVTDAWDLRRRLRLGGGWRGEEATSYGHEERTSVHEEPPPDRPSRRDRRWTAKRADLTPASSGLARTSSPPSGACS